MGNTFWFTGSDYNTARVIEKIADIVLKHGGRVNFNDEGVEIRPRGYRPYMEKAQKDIERAEFFLKDTTGVFTKEETKAKLREIIATLQNDLKELERKEEDAPVIKSRFASKYGLCTGNIEFVLDHTLYTFEFADNPFFPDYWKKIQLNDNDEYIGVYYSDNLVPEDTPKDYFVDELWKPCAAEETIDDVAEDIFERLMKKPHSERYKGDCRYVTVPNTYNDGYHREKVYDTDNKKRKVDF